eukprot:CAMPEP_0202967792 /NCGR_PEP_ID=MMETSP1396-20130829/12793_1 /ASSEMBLY_ACC=CAM_ASM_000872 /TAXON_ID= /ORGANISM="Pseudokeronopsis sp., Strain Brazil" /LENGTH=60 /DNA_ID=CAMNT_0049693271 /DNA_START=1409 /DNA_END=1591 /DNA_ORIENTATION=-
MTVTFDEAYLKQPQNCFVRWVKNLDVRFMKPLLIYDFANYKEEKKRQKMMDPRSRPLLEH